MAKRVDLKVVGRRLIKEVGDDDVSGLATEMAYRFFLALFPFLIFLTATGGMVARWFGVENPAEEIMGELETHLPEDAGSVLLTQLESTLNRTNGGLLSLSLLGAIWAASSGVQTTMKALNRIHEVKESRKLPVRYALAVGITLLAGVGLVGAFIVLVAGQVAGLEVAEAIGLEGPTRTLLSLARWPLVGLSLLLIVAFIYWAVPNIDLPFRWISPGAIVFMIGWLVGTFIFGLYVANFASYNATYGTLGGIVVLLLWLYLSSFIMLVGAELNAVLAQEAIPDELPARAGDAATPDTVPDHHKAQPDVPGEPSEAPSEPTTHVSGRGAVAMTTIVAFLAFWLGRLSQREGDVKG